MEGGEDVARDLLGRWYAAWNAHDVEAAVALLTDDVRYEDPTAHRAVLHGKEAVAEYMRNAFSALAEFHLEMQEEWVSPGGETSASYFTMSGVFTGKLAAPGLPPLAPTNKPVRVVGMDRNTFRDDLMSRHQIFWDVNEFGRQMGSVPLRGTTMEKVIRQMQRVGAARLRRRSLSDVETGTGDD